MSHSDVTFYLSTIGSVLAILAVFWKITLGEKLKRMEEEAVTKLDLIKELSLLKDFLRKEFISRDEYNARRKG